MIVGNIRQAFDNLVDVRAVGDTDRNADAVPGRRATGLVNDFRIADHAVRDGDFDIIARKDTGAAQTDVGDFATLARVKDDEVTDLVGRIGNDGQAGKQVRQCVLRREAERETNNTGGSQPCGDIDIPGQEDDRILILSFFISLMNLFLFFL